MTRSLLVRGLVAASALAVLHGAAAAQSPLLDVPNGSIRPAGDVNGDGHGDLVLGQYGYTDGRALLINGNDGSTLFEWSSPPNPNGYEEFAASVAGGGDVDGDGVPDVAVGAPQRNGSFGPPEFNSGHVTVFSGADGSELRSWRGLEPRDAFGFSVAFLGDLDGDGKAELAVGAIEANDYIDSFGPGYVTVLRGSDGSVMHLFPGPGTNEAMFGYVLGAAGDVDADGVPDLIVGDPGSPFFGTTPSYVSVYSGASGAILHEIVGSNTSWGKVGEYVAGAGDLDQDGFADFAYVRRRTQSVPSKLFFVSGASGSVIRSVTNWLSEDCNTGPCYRIGRALETVGDMDLDGFEDVTFGIWGWTNLPAHAFVLSGRDGSFLLELSGSGGWIAGAGDVDGDGYPDFASNVGSESGPTVYSGCDGSWTSFGQGCAGTNGVVPELSVRGCPTPSRKIYLAIEDGLPGAEARLFVGSWQATLPGGVPCPLLVEPVMLHPVRPGFPSTTLDADGSGEIAFRIPNGLAPGTTYTAQVRITDPASPTGYSATQGVEITVR